MRRSVFGAVKRCGTLILRLKYFRRAPFSPLCCTEFYLGVFFHLLLNILVLISYPQSALISGGSPVKLGPLS